MTSMVMSQRIATVIASIPSPRERNTRRKRSRQRLVARHRQARNETVITAAGDSMFILLHALESFSFYNGSAQQLTTDQRESID